MTEVPLVYPNNAFPPRRYVVDSDTQILRRVEVIPQSEETASSSTTTLVPPMMMMEGDLAGSASISSLILNGKDTILTTSARFDNPTILS